MACFSNGARVFSGFLASNTYLSNYFFPAILPLCYLATPEIEVEIMTEARGLMSIKGSTLIGSVRIALNLALSLGALANSWYPLTFKVYFCVYIYVCVCRGAYLASLYAFLFF